MLLNLTGKIDMTGAYNSDASFFDGLTKGIRYRLKEHNGNQYLIKKNDLGGTSTIAKEKFVDVKDDLLVAAETALKE